jgi:hypothetical protein
MFGFTKKYTNKFYCFSPPVMLATFLIEITFAIYVAWRYKMNTISRLVVAILTFLAIFQLSEFLICGGLGWQNFQWSRLGYASITMLPPLGLHLSAAIARKNIQPLLIFAYSTAVAFIAFYVFATQAITGATCYANYVVFDTHQASSIPYALYYYGWLFVGVFASLHWSKDTPVRTRRALLALAVGYMSFIIPTTTVNIINPSTISGIPSIMCGFAVILAFILAGKVAPEAALPRKEATSALASLKNTLFNRS